MLTGVPAGNCSCGWDGNQYSVCTSGLAAGGSVSGCLIGKPEGCARTAKATDVTFSSCLVRPDRPDRPILVHSFALSFDIERADLVMLLLEDMPGATSSSRLLSVNVVFQGCVKTCTIRRRSSSCVTFSLRDYFRLNSNGLRVLRLTLYCQHRAQPGCYSVPLELHQQLPEPCMCPRARRLRVQVDAGESYKDDNANMSNPTMIQTTNFQCSISWKRGSRMISWDTHHSCSTSDCQRCVKKGCQNYQNSPL